MAYEGYSNYETWCVDLWLNNERDLYEDKREIIRNAKSKYVAARDLKRYVEYMMPDPGASMFADLLGAAMIEVDWDEIVEADWAELHANDDKQEEEAE